jgi:hypothetical protein
MPGEAADLADAVDRELSAVGYQCLHRSADAANYLRGNQRLDFLYAHRPAARQFPRSARELQTPFGTLHVVSAAGLSLFEAPTLAHRAAISEPASVTQSAAEGGRLAPRVRLASAG